MSAKGPPKHSLLSIAIPWGMKGVAGSVVTTGVGGGMDVVLLHLERTRMGFGGWTGCTSRTLFGNKFIGPDTPIDSLVYLLWEWRNKTDCKHRIRVVERTAIELTIHNLELKF